MPPKKVKDWAEVAGKAAVHAAQMALPWDQVLSPQVSKWMRATSKSQGSLAEYYLMSLLPLVNGLLGSRTSIELEKDWKVSPALYCVCIGASGTNKSGAHKKCLVGPVTHVNNCAQEGNDCDGATGLLLDQYTTSGLHKHLSENQGEAIIASDELHMTLGAALQREKESGGDRQILCKLWSNSGWNSKYATTNARQVTDTNVCLSGTTTYDCWAPIVQELRRVGDGLLDRMLVCLGKPYWPTSVDRKEGKASLLKMPPVDLEKLAREIHDHHHGDTSRVYTLSEDALEDINEAADGEAALRNEMAAQGMFNVKDSSAKLTDNVVKVALGLHLLESHVTAQLRRQSPKTGYTIEATTVRRAFAFVQHCRAQQACFLEALEDEGKISSVPSQILTLPGPFFRVRDIRRQMGRKAPSICQLNANLNSLVSIGAGQTRTIKPGKKGGRPFEVFVKTSPLLIGDLLRELQVDPTRYSDQFFKAPEESLMKFMATFLPPTLLHRFSQRHLSSQVDRQPSSRRPAATVSAEVRPEQASSGQTACSTSDSEADLFCSQQVATHIGQNRCLADVRSRNMTTQESVVPDTDSETDSEHLFSHQVGKQRKRRKGLASLDEGVPPAKKRKTPMHQECLAGNADDDSDQDMFFSQLGDKSQGSGPATTAKDSPSICDSDSESNSDSESDLFGSQLSVHISPADDVPSSDVPSSDEFDTVPPTP